MQMGAPGVMPFGHAPPQPQLPPGYMVYPNGAVGHQGMMPYGFPPAMTPVPMLTHPRTAQQGAFLTYSASCLQRSYKMEDCSIHLVSLLMKSAPVLNA